MCRKLNLIAICLSVLGFFSIPGTSAVSLQDLELDPNLTPEKFAQQFAGFKFVFRGKIQDSRTFLATRSGDCDDYAILAANVLREKGYTPRLIAVRMPGLVHVVCYIEETQSYLDYNFRGRKETIACTPALESIGASVAKSYNSRWTSASEFTFSDGVKRLVATVRDDNRSGSERRIAGLAQ